MVWGLFPADPLSGDEKYYIFSKGTYRVGRKGCDVIINKDKGVSRIHTEIVIDAMTSLDYPQNKSSNISSKVRIRDCSKYGTFINKNLGSKEKVHEFPNKETTLKDGDLVSFGTGNATYRFCSVPFIFFVCYSESFQSNQLLQDKISSIGACITYTWTPECTHVLIDDFMPLKEDLLDAIVAKKPFVHYNWVEFIAEKNICTEIPSCSFYAPTLTLEGVSIKVADPRSRENCFRGYTFLLESKHKYKFKDRLESLLQVAGAKVVSGEGFYMNSQDLEDEGNNTMVRVIPAGLADSSECFRNLSSLSRVNEINLICAALSGHLDASLLVSAPVLVTSSCSTDETVIADSDAEIEITSVHTSAAAAAHVVESVEHDSKEGMAVHIIESTEHESIVEISTDHVDDRSKSAPIPCLRDKIDSITPKREKVDESESGNSDIIYSQDLIVRETNLPTSDHFSTSSAVLNFKCFRKGRTQSGNSFHSLVPFAKYPYKDFDYGSEDIVESVKEEKKRKEMEAVAEDLFNNVKGGRRGVADSIRGLFVHS